MKIIFFVVMLIRFKLKSALILLFITTSLSSCLVQKNIKYLQPRTKTNEVEQFQLNNSYSEYTIEKGDILSIQVNSTVATDVDIIDKKFKSDKGSSGDNLYGYEVDNNGNITLPLLDKVKLEGLSLSQASDTLQKRFQEYIKYVTVKVALKEFRFSVLGEIGKPGQVITPYTKVTIFNAIALSGDFTYYSNRKKVKLLRKEGGYTKVYTLDLSDKNILTSDKYYLKPNDVIIVDTRNVKLIQENIKVFSVMISVVSVGLMVFLRTKNII
ncbi:MAG: polysaccharide biosynthesis/export family protein [Cytophagales bacterium]